MPNFISENQIEQALLQKLQHVHGFDALDCFTENAEDLNGGSNRATDAELVIIACCFTSRNESCPCQGCAQI